MMKLDSLRLATNIKREFYVYADDAYSPDLVVVTNSGFVTLQLRNDSVYMLLLLGESGDLPLDIEIPPESNWLVETSADGQSGALVCEFSFRPCSPSASETGTEAELAEVIIDLLRELSVFAKGGN